MLVVEFLHELNRVGGGIRQRLGHLGHNLLANHLRTVNGLWDLLAVSYPRKVRAINRKRVVLTS